MRLTFCVVVSATGEIVHTAVNFYRDTRATNGEVHSVASNFVLTNDVDAFATQSA